MFLAGARSMVHDIRSGEGEPLRLRNQHSTRDLGGGLVQWSWRSLALELCSSMWPVHTLALVNISRKEAILQYLQQVLPPPQQSSDD